MAEPELTMQPTYPTVDEMNTLIAQLISGSFTILDHFPDSVFRVNNLLQAIFQRSCSLWQQCLDVLLEQLAASLQVSEEWLVFLSTCSPLQIKAECTFVLKYSPLFCQY